MAGLIRVALLGGIGFALGYDMGALGIPVVVALGLYVHLVAQFYSEKPHDD